MSSHGELFDPDQGGFAFGPSRGGTDVGQRAWIVARMAIIVAVLAGVTALALYGLGYLVKLQLDRVLLTA